MVRHFHVRHFQRPSFTKYCYTICAAFEIFHTVLLATVAFLLTTYITTYLLGHDRSLEYMILLHLQLYTTETFRRFPYRNMYPCLPAGYFLLCYFHGSLIYKNYVSKWVITLLTADFITGAVETFVKHIYIKNI